MGEYAVLDGAGAIVAAVDHGVACTRTPGALGWSTPGDDRFVSAALADQPLDIGQFAFQDWNPVDLGGAKPGFGGSAAATVAAVLAAGRPAADAFEVHRRVQGSGSGVDVFAAINGGVRRFPDGAPVSPPLLGVVWSGRSAQTGPRVAQYQAWGAADPRARRAFVLDSRALVDSFGVTPIASTREAWRRLCAMSRAAGIDYATPEHVALAELAERCGGAGKPSGAGGGDVAVAVFPDPERLAVWARQCAALNFTVIPTRVAPAADLRALHGPRVDLLPFTPERLILAMRDRAGLARDLEAAVPASWPQPDYAAVLPILAERCSRDATEARWAWLVVDRERGELIGEIGGKVAPSRRGDLEFGYAIIPERRRQGYATEAGEVFQAWALGQRGVRRLTAECLESNVASRGVLARLGLQPCGTRTERGLHVLKLRGG